MKTSESIELIAAALAEAQALIEPAPKDKTNPHFKSKYADITGVWEACRPALGKFNLCVIQSPSMTPERLVRITTRVIHKSGQWFESELDLKPDRDSPQSIGSAITYGKRYALAAMIGVVADEDDDGNEASGKPKFTPQAKPIPPKQPQPAPKPPQEEKRRIFDKNRKEHIEGLAKCYERENYPDGFLTPLIEAMHGHEVTIENIKKMMDKILKSSEEGIA